MRSKPKRRREIIADLTQGSIMAWGHANLLGCYDFRELTSSKNDDEFTDNDVMTFRMKETVTASELLV